MTREELLALPLRELDAMVAEKVMGWTDVRFFKYGDGSGQYVKNLEGNNGEKITTITSYSSDDNAVRLVRNRIAELGLEQDFIQFLEGQTKLAAVTNWDQACFLYMQATPQQQCISAILAVQEKERRE